MLWLGGITIKSLRREDDYRFKYIYIEDTSFLLLFLKLKNFPMTLDIEYDISFRHIA